MTNKRLYVILSFLISLYFFKASFSKLNTDVLTVELSQVSLILVTMSILTLILAYLVRIERWKRMFNSNSNLNWALLCRSYFVSFALNNILPLRAGDIYRAISLKKYNIPLSTVTSTMVAEKILDLFIIVIFFILFAILFNITHEHFFKRFLMFFLIVLIGILIIINLSSSFKHKKFKINHLNKLKTFFESVIAQGKQILNKKKIMALINWSLLAWSLECLCYFFTALSISSLDNTNSSFFAFSVGTLSTLIPSSPGYVGTFDYFIIKIMTLFGNTYQSAALYSILLHLILWSPITIIGLIFMSFSKFVNYDKR